MTNIKLRTGEIFEINNDTSHTYFYDGYEMTEITMQEYNIIHNIEITERSKALRDFRWNNRY
jgi:hypothetical protein